MLLARFTCARSFETLLVLLHVHTFPGAKALAVMALAVYCPELPCGNHRMARNHLRCVASAGLSVLRLSQQKDRVKGRVFTSLYSISMQGKCYENVR